MKLMKVCMLLLVVGGVFVLFNQSALGNGGKGKKIRYLGYIETGEHGTCLFSSEIEPVMFVLNSVQNKYKVVRIKIKNQSKKPIRLSKQKDKIELQFDHGNIQGILNLAKHDADFWDSLKLELRKALVYPQIVEPNGEEENIYVFVPDAKLNKFPKAFVYTIDNLHDKKVHIRNEETMAAH